MNNKIATWIAAVALILFGAFAFWGVQKIFTPAPPQIKSDTIKIPFDTVAFQKKFREMLQLKPVVKYKDTGSIRWKDNLIFIPYYKATRQDTINDYIKFHETLWGKDTLTNDQNLFYEATHGITQNRLISFEGRYFWKHPETTIQNLPIQSLTPTRKLYIGAGIGSDLRDNMTISGRITLVNKNDALYGIEITFIPGQKLVYSLHHDIKIKL